MVTQVILFVRPSRLSFERAIRTLGSKLCLSKRRQDITDLEPQAIYESPLRTPSVRKLSAQVFHQNNIEQVCISSHTFSLLCRVTSRGCCTEIIP